MPSQRNRGPVINYTTSDLRRSHVRLYNRLCQPAFCRFVRRRSDGGFVCNVVLRRARCLCATPIASLPASRCAIFAASLLHPRSVQRPGIRSRLNLSTHCGCISPWGVRYHVGLTFNHRTPRRPPRQVSNDHGTTSVGGKHLAATHPDEDPARMLLFFLCIGALVHCCIRAACLQCHVPGVRQNTATTNLI